jgi:hypothetical protein
VTVEVIAINKTSSNAVTLDLYVYRRYDSEVAEDFIIFDSEKVNIEI